MNQLGPCSQVGSWAGWPVPGVPSFPGSISLSVTAHFGDGSRCFPNQVRDQGSAHLPAYKAHGLSSELPCLIVEFSATDPQVRIWQVIGCSRVWPSHTQQVQNQGKGCLSKVWGLLKASAHRFPCDANLVLGVQLVGTMVAHRPSTWYSCWLQA